MKANIAALLVLVLFGGTAHAALWTPDEITTVAWFDAADASTIHTSGGEVAKWDDKSGNGYNLTSPSGVGPATGTNTLGGLNVLTFDQGDKMNGPITLPAAGNVSSYIVFDFISADSTSRVIHQFGGQQLLPDSTNDSSFDPRYGGNTFTGGPYPGPVIIELVHDTGASKTLGYITGNQSLDRSYLFSTTDTSLRLMRNANNAAGIASHVGEFVIVPDSTAATRELVEGYLAWKWGLETDLPATHPYKSAAPTVGPAGVPEPASLALGGIGGLMLLLIRRRKR